MLSKTLALVLLALGTTASHINDLGGAVVEKRACAGVHVFGARETTASAGFGSSGTVVDAIVKANSGATSEAIAYPACGGQASCGGVAYANSVSQGTAAVVSAVKAYAAQCPSSSIVLVGYSQGGEIFDAALCGAGGAGGSLASYNIKAAIFMGNPRFNAGAPYNVGTCKAGGFDKREGTCGNYNSQIQSYCDAADPYCCNGNSQATHQGYGTQYGAAAAAFVQKRLLSLPGRRVRRQIGSKIDSHPVEMKA